MGSRFSWTAALILVGVPASALLKNAVTSVTSFAANERISIPDDSAESFSSRLKSLVFRPAPPLTDPYIPHLVHASDECFPDRPGQPVLIWSQLEGCDKSLPKNENTNDLARRVAPTRRDPSSAEMDSFQAEEEENQPEKSRRALDVK